MLRILIIALVLLTGATVWLSSFRQNLPEPAVATYLPGGLALPDVRLSDENDRPFATSDLEDRFTLVFFGFTHCPDVCPLTLQTLASAMENLRARQVELPGVLFVSVDPARDSPERMRRYLANFDAGFSGVTGPDDALNPLTSTLGVHVERHQHGDEAAYNVTHTPTIFLVGPEAELIAVFSSPHDSRTIASDFLLVRQRYLIERRESAPRS
jgi:protein SCO1/2